MKLDDKVTFPLAGLTVGRHLYDLYACVCHFGGITNFLKKSPLLLSFMGGCAVGLLRSLT